MIRFLQHYGTLMGFAAIMVAFTLLLPGTFLASRNLINVSQQISMLAVAAFAMTIVMVMNDYDLSIGSMASLAGIVAAVVFAAGYPVAVGIAAALAVGVLGGALNGFLVSMVGILPFVATLGTLTVFSGAAFFIAGGRTFYGRDIPSGFSDFARAGLPLDHIGLAGAKLPYLTLSAIVMLAVVWFVLEHTAYGRKLYAIGGNREAAHLAGINVRSLRLSAFALTGLGAAIAGLMYAARVASANPTQGSGLMLDAIAAVFLGMTTSREGEPRVLATLLGVMILGFLDNGLTQLNVDSYIRDMLVGSIILVAVAIPAISKQKAG